MRSPTTAAIGAATVGITAAAAIVFVARRRPTAPIPTRLRTRTALLGEYRGSRYVPPAAAARAGGDQPDADSYTPFLVWAATTPLDAPEVDASGRSDGGSSADVEDPDQLWRQLCAIEYRIQNITGGNDGPLATDLPTSDEAAAAAHIAARLSELVGIPTGTLRARAGDAAYAHGQDPGTDHDPDRFAPPDWAQVRASGWPGW